MCGDRVGQCVNGSSGRSRWVIRGDGGQAKVATGTRSRDWMPPFCGRMTNLGKIKGRWGRGVIIIIKKKRWGSMQSNKRVKRREEEELVLLVVKIYRVVGKRKHGLNY